MTAPLFNQDTETISLALCADGNVIPSLHVCLLTAFEAASPGIAFDVHLVTPPHFDRSEIARLETTLRLAGRPFTLTHVPTDVAELRAFRGLQGEHTPHLKWVLPELLPNVDRLIILDTDLIVRADLAELWSTPLNGHAVAAVPVGTVKYSCDTQFMLSLGAPLDLPYFNTGVMLVSVAAWTAAGLTETFRRFAQQHAPHLRAADQTVYNGVLAVERRIVPLDDKFNHPIYPDAPACRCDEGRLYHLLGVPKPWDPFGRLLNNHSPVYFRELARTACNGRRKRLSPLRWVKRVARLSRAYAVGIRTRLRR